MQTFPQSIKGACVADVESDGTRHCTTNGFMFASERRARKNDEHRTKAADDKTARDGDCVSGSVKNTEHHTDQSNSRQDGSSENKHGNDLPTNPFREQTKE